MDLICWRLLSHVHILRALGISLLRSTRAFRPPPPTPLDAAAATRLMRLLPVNCSQPAAKLPPVLALVRQAPAATAIFATTL